MDFNIIEESDKQKEEKNKKQNNLLIYASLFFFALSIILLIIYFATPKKTETVAPQPIQTIVKEEPVIPPIVDSSSSQRPLAIMIDTNIGDAKHAGLQESYVNYEMIVEGGLTRIMAIYKDKDVNVVGPVRSARHYFLDYALEHDAVYAHFGWSPYAEENIKSLKVQNINGMIETSPFARDRKLPSPHNVFTSTTKLRNIFEKLNYSSTSNNWQVFTYSNEEIELDKLGQNNLQNASRVSMTYSSSEYRTYTYDTLNKYYLRSKNGSAHIDRRTDKQLHYKNIIIMKVENKTIDKEGRQELKTTGTGEGYFITDGYAVPIKWTKEKRNSKTVYSYLNGEMLKLNNGNTFIQIVPLTSKIEIE